jgi:hypothetical protein
MVGLQSPRYRVQANCETAQDSGQLLRALRSTVAADAAAAPTTTVPFCFLVEEDAAGVDARRPLSSHRARSPSHLPAKGTGMGWDSVLSVLMQGVLTNLYGAFREYFNLSISWFRSLINMNLVGLVV